MAASSSRSTDLRPWVEKYRPKSVDDVSHQGEVIDALRHAIEQKNLPHLIFYGPPGTGKTSTILAAARTIFGEHMRERVMELNASDERGISVVRNKIKTFAQVAVSSSACTAAGARLPPYKLIILDEADSMTTDAQSALRRTMETYSKVTRFCIICNYISRLIPPIASRCAKFRFQPLPHDSMIERLQYIASVERVAIDESTLVELIRASEGDMRRAIGMLQSLHRLYGAEMSPSAVLDISGALPAAQLAKTVAVCRANDFAAMSAWAAELLADGFPVSQLVAQLLDHVAESAEIDSLPKAKIALALAEADKQLTDGAGEYLQLMNVLAATTRNLVTTA